MIARLARLMRAIGRDRSGLALIEFAYSMPILVALGMSGTELANYATTKMRISQLALEIADHGSRIGENGVLQDIKIYESDINDVFTGAQLQSGRLDLKAAGKVYLTQLQTQVQPDGSYKQVEGWKRCYGNLVAPQTYTVQTDGMGVAGSRVTAEPGGATIFVELHYTYSPLFPLANGLNPLTLNLVDIAAYSVRDDRDLTQVYQTNPAAPVSACT